LIEFNPIRATDVAVPAGTNLPHRVAPGVVFCWLSPPLPSCLLPLLPQPLRVLSHFEGGLATKVAVCARACVTLYPSVVGGPSCVCVCVRACCVLWSFFFWGGGGGGHGSVARVSERCVLLSAGAVFVISNSCVTANKYVSAGSCYNKRVVECRAAAMVLASLAGLEKVDCVSPALVVGRVLLALL